MIRLTVTIRISILKKLARRALFFLTVISLLGVNIFPREPVLALNKSTNWDFATGSTGWTATANTGTDTCGATTTTSPGTVITTFAYTGAAGNPAGSFSAVSGTGNNTDYRGKITQTFVAPGSGNVAVQGRFDYFANSQSFSATANSSWIRVDIYNSTDTTFVASMGCISFNSNQAWTTNGWSGAVNLTGGTTYTIRVSMRTLTKATGAKAITLGVDNVTVNAAPTGLAITAPFDTTNASLSWTASSGTPALHATTPYKIYRDTTSPASTFLANATSNTYLDTSTSDNITYYYAITDVDTNNIESTKSGTVGVLTRTGAPGTPSFTNIARTTLTVNWTAPTNGATTYAVERCTGTGCINYSQIASGSANLYYNDTSLNFNTVYRYRVRGTNAAGFGVYSNAAEVTTAATISVSITTNGTVSYGFVGMGSSKNTTASGLNQTQTARNDGEVNETFNIKTSNALGGTTWTVGSAAGSNIYVHEFSSNGGGGWTKFSTADSYQTLVTGITPTSSQSFDLRLTAPTSTSDYQQKTITITIQATL